MTASYDQIDRSAIDERVKAGNQNGDNFGDGGPCELAGKPVRPAQYFAECELADALAVAERRFKDFDGLMVAFGVDTELLARGSGSKANTRPRLPTARRKQ